MVKPTTRSPSQIAKALATVESSAAVGSELSLKAMYDAPHFFLQPNTCLHVVIRDRLELNVCLH